MAIISEAARAAIPPPGDSSQALKILITGAAGMLGQDMVPAFPDDEVLPADITGDCARLDITDLAAVRSFITKHRPDIALHLAAYTNVDGCETDSETAWRVNASGTWNLAAACAESGSAMLYISTDFVFDGEKGSPYDEFDRPDPLGVYGRSKYAGECLVRAMLPRHYIVRTAWLYGVHGKSFPGTMIRVASEGKPLRVVSDQTGSPTYTVDLAQAVSRIIRQPLYGTYHATNSGQCTWYDLASETLRLHGLSEADLSPISSDQYPTPTKRPAYSVLEHRAMQLAGLPPMRPWQEALADYIANYKEAAANQK